MPVSTGTPTAPTKTGWHLVSFQNGDLAVVRWDNGQFQWGSIPAPASPIVGMSFLGTQASGLNAALLPFIKSMSATAQATVIASLDQGNLQQGRPQLIQGALAPSQQQPGHFGEAIPTNIIPSPIPATAGTGGHISVDVGGVLSGIWSFLTSPSSWVRILEYVGGAALIWLALREAIH